MKNISAILITKNEEKNIRGCIESLKDVVAEIVVVDSGSKDRTLEIAREYTDKIFQTEWKGFGSVKNFALEKTSGEWIFWIDADERLTPELAEEIRNCNEQRENAFEVPRLAFFLGYPIRHGGWFPGYVLRLFRRGKGRFSEKPIHEFLEVEGERGRMKNHLIHLTDPKSEHYFEKLNIYTTLAAEELYKEGKRVNILILLIHPIGIFFKMFLIRLGFLDGIPGFLLAVFSSFYVFVKYAKLWEKWNSRVKNH